MNKNISHQSITEAYEKINESEGALSEIDQNERIGKTAVDENGNEIPHIYVVEYNSPEDFFFLVKHGEGKIVGERQKPYSKYENKYYSQREIKGLQFLLGSSYNSPVTK